MRQLEAVMTNSTSSLVIDLLLLVSTTLLKRLVVSQLSLAFFLQTPTLTHKNNGEGSVLTLLYERNATAI